jgi:hypothetical protein
MDRDWKSEFGRRNGEGGKVKSEMGMRKVEKSEIGSWKWEIGIDWKWECGMRKWELSEVGRWEKASRYRCLGLQISCFPTFEFS